MPLNRKLVGVLVALVLCEVAARVWVRIAWPPERITQRAQEIGLVVPDAAPVAVPIVGDVPKRGTSSDVIDNYEEVKRHLDASP